MIERKIQSSKGTIYYWTNEIVPPQEIAIVFCHGLTGDHTLFDKQVEHLFAEYKLITWDFPLHGKSRPYEDFSFANVNEEMLTILEQENIEKIVLVGQSAGGYIAQSFIYEYGDKVIGFIGIGTTPYGKSYYKKSELFWIKQYSTIARLYPFSYYCKAGAKAITVTDEARTSMYKTLVSLGKKDMLKAASAVYGEFLKIDDEVQFNCPVLITYGEYDNTGYVKKYCNSWAEKTGYPLKIISSASHNANYDNYEEFNGLLVSFVQSII
ncbi:alpha/beta fold hydrolase [Cytobacillus purgationiresistens]|uniref:Pimeloyl-ACP methyl ester carboxylesterase n=1 Tax=Cytobacillus purgationiresistens TaxID=863449 RepID=A0ABU0ARA1_9BACI|nr:alpha/beta hydrolase [Cytobacillus purgationiresistens]MDQ0273808.1 pimeloyl-ACP methyl ester carboxylesterase [Cytobacillus purgationiresistens]